MSAPSLPELLTRHWHLAWGLNAQALFYAGLYLWGARRVRGHWPLRRCVSFLAGILCIVVALESGLDTFDGRLLSVHMVQHMVLLQVAPLLLLGGRPLILALRALSSRRRTVLARALTLARPLTTPFSCLAIFSGVLILTHLPSFYGATLHNPVLHEIEHFVYLITGLLLWWPVLDGDPVPRHRLGGLGRIIYVLAAMPAMALVGAYLNRHASLVYSSYGAQGRSLGVSAVVDQQRAGAIMVAVGLRATIGALLAEERRQRARESRRAPTGLSDPTAVGGPLR